MNLSDVAGRQSIFAQLFLILLVSSLYCHANLLHWWRPQRWQHGMRSDFSQDIDSKY